MKVKGNFWVNNAGFATFFNEVIQPSNPALFPTKINVSGYEHFVNHIALWSPRILSLEEFIAVFCAVYQETGGRFESISEYGSKAYFESKPYGYRYRGRGFLQLTWERNYQIVFSSLGLALDTFSDTELDELFKQDKIAFGSIRVMFSDERLLKRAFEGLALGKYKEFGTSLNGSSYYGQVLENRVLYILQQLKGQKIQNSIFLRNKQKILTALALIVIFSVSGYIFYKYKVSS
ncbi:MAG: hypothetical protein RMJ97_07005 [Raineya sp.]|nr:hypothetical protein [Raineya sp.]MDW8296618.1 hypothetical protein [Raineya sp.]